MAHDEHSKSHGYVPDKDAYLKRLRRIEGQVRGIARMVDEDTYCIDVLTQVSAASSALRSVALVLLEQHLQHCLAEAAHRWAPGTAVRFVADVSVIQRWSEAKS